jgi:putrescine---pyruvate transaminase
MISSPPPSGASSALKSPTLREMDQAHHLHPFTNHSEMHAQGTHIIESADGCWVYDDQGRKLLDGLAGLWCVNVGYNRKPIIDAVKTQMERLCYYPSFFNSTTEPAIRLADRLARLAPPNLNHVVFSNSGSEANETALKIIRSYHKINGQPRRTKILTREFAYHGVTLATTSMTGLASCYAPFDLPMAGFIHVPGPHAYAAQTPLSAGAYGQWCIEETARIIEREGAETIAALFAEPVQGAGGVVVPPAGYLRELRALCRRQGILFVADEVITAFGRLGDWFASSLWDLDPDLITTAKGLTSGYLPLGATLLSDPVSETVTRTGYFAHGYTYSGHPVSAAAALANLDLIESEKLIPRVRDDIGPYFQSKLVALRSHPCVGEARGTGLIGALELVPRAGRAALKPDAFLGVHGAKVVREQGVIVRGIRDILAMAPPLIITHEEIDFLFQGVQTALDRME